ncbi:MAG: helix-turn-helix transcriptional regulator [Bacteroidales bacterium]|nr:helix-turn-helix transcriptional regulator [Bacteroidales bacterium]
MISKRITEIRKLKKITEKELSEKIGMSLTGFRQALANDDFKVRTLPKIAQCINVEISFLIKEI